MAKTTAQRISSAEKRLAEIDRIASEGKTSRKLAHERSRHQRTIWELRHPQMA